MGKGGKDIKRDPERELSWEEVKKHNKREDKWLVIDNNVYDITQWSKRHPGGSKVISHYAGQDATEAFTAFHPDKKFVGKFLKSIQIGKVNHDDFEYSQDGLTTKKCLDIKKDFEILRQNAEKRGYFKPSITFFTLTVLHLVVIELAALAVLYYGGNGWLPWLASAVLMATVQAQAGWSQHDFGHLSVCKTSYWNHFIHQFVMSLTKGAAPSWWNHLHYQHHAKPNVLEKDPDVRLEKVFVLGDVMPKRMAKKKNTMPYNLQHQYFFAIGPPLLFPLYFQVMIFRHVIQRKQWLDLSLMMVFYFKIATLYKFLLGGWSSMLLWYFIMRVIESHWFVWVTQSNHIPMEIDDDKARAWLPLQMHATCDIEKSYFNDWFTGHLNFQIEHHLFPTMPRHNLYKIKPDVEALCKKHGVPYVTKSLGQAFYDIPKTLKHSGELWLAHYQMHHH